MRSKFRRQRDQKPQRQRQHAQKDDARDHAGSLFPRVEIALFRAEEYLKEHAAKIEHRHERAEDKYARKKRMPRVERALDDQKLCKIAGKRGYAHYGERAERKGRGGQRETLIQPAHAVDVLGVQVVLHNARAEEQPAAFATLCARI